MGDTNGSGTMVDFEQDLARLKEDLYAVYILQGAFLVFFMQAGFALLEAGTVRKKAAKNILLKNVLDACIGGVLWWAVGHSFAFGERGAGPNAFIGGKHFFSINSDNHPDSEVIYHAKWIFSWTFAATTATIVSGAVAERCKFQAYLIYTIVMTGLVYPVVVHWMWSLEGWLSPFRDDSTNHVGSHLGGMGVMDFAGSGVVHVTGGGAALIGAWIIGPRDGRFNSQGRVQNFKSHSPSLATLGTFILWFGWYAFNGTSIHCFAGCIDTAASIAVNTTISACASGLIVLPISWATGKPGDVAPVLSGILAGLVAITAPCAMVEPFSACIIGLVAGIVYLGSSSFLQWKQIDDPLDASPVHFFCGIWGLIAVGIFATEDGVMAAYDRNDAPGFGFLYGAGGGQFGRQVLGALIISCWTLFFNLVLFRTLNYFRVLRISVEEETVLGPVGPRMVDPGRAEVNEMPRIHVTENTIRKNNLHGGASPGSNEQN